MENDIELFIDFGKGVGRLLKYAISNDINEIAEAAIQKMGVIIPDLHEVEWKLNLELSPNVMDLMNSKNVNYSMTTFEDNELLNIVINKRVGNKWYIYGGRIFEGKFYSYDDFNSLLNRIVSENKGMQFVCYTLLKDEGYSPKMLGNGFLSFDHEEQEYRIYIDENQRGYFRLSYSGTIHCETTEDKVKLFINASINNIMLKYVKTSVFLTENNSVMQIMVSFDTTFNDNQDFGGQLKLALNEIEFATNSLLKYIEEHK